MYIMFQYIYILVYTWIMLHYIYSYTDNVTLYIWSRICHSFWLAIQLVNSSHLLRKTFFQMFGMIKEKTGGLASLTLESWNAIWYCFDVFVDSTSYDLCLQIEWMAWLSSPRSVFVARDDGVHCYWIQEIVCVTPKLLIVPSGYD